MDEQRESTQTRPLFDKACRELNDVLEAGRVEDPKYMDVVMQTYVGHIKIVNAERSKDALKYAVVSSLAENKEELKELISNNMGAYTKNLLIK